MMMHLRQELPSGILDLDITRSAFAPDELFGLAERQNPKRAFLFVSKILGRHVPAPPGAMRRAHRWLAARLSLQPGARTLFVGLAETAIALGAGVFREARAPGALFLASTRHEFARDVLARFEEKHSHASSHIIYEPQIPLGDKPLHLVLVDDEMTTGRTFNELRAALAERWNIAAVTRVVLTDWSGTACHAEPVISLLEGSWRWTASAPVEPPPEHGTAARERARISGRQDWGRFGTVDAQCAAWSHIHEEPGRKVLVLGTGEFVWPPFLLAERLEREGARVLFGATTLSPIREGLAITSRFVHEDNYGLGRPNYLYNVNPGDFDAVYLCCETPRANLDQSLLRHLGQEKTTVLEYG